MGIVDSSLHWLAKTCIPAFGTYNRKPQGNYYALSKTLLLNHFFPFYTWITLWEKAQVFFSGTHKLIFGQPTWSDAVNLHFSKADAMQMLRTLTCCFPSFTGNSNFPYAAFNQITQESALSQYLWTLHFAKFEFGIILQFPSMKLKLFILLHVYF